LEKKHNFTIQSNPCYKLLIMKTSKAKLVIYHADCLDGLGSAWAAFCKFGHNARYFAARFGDKFQRFNKGSDIYILDCSTPQKQPPLSR
jgi:hypothetical protein